MNISIEKIRKNEVLIKGVFEDVIDEKHPEIVEGLKEKKRFQGKFGELYTVSAEEEIIFLGLGKKEDITAERGRVAAAKALKEMKKLKIDSADFEVFSKCNKIIRGIIDGLMLGDYTFNKYKSKDESFKIEGVNLIIEKDIEEWIPNEGISLAKSTMIARDLVNEPANVIYPESLGDRVIEFGKEFGFEVEVMDEEKIIELGMESFMSVGRASSKRPKLIVMRYKGDIENETVLGLVGKGVTYDSGGYSIKPTPSMVSMKSDMGGAAAVIGAMCAISQMKLKKNVVAVVAACENMISEDAYKPGDVINSMAGKTIEVLNTDAEGRLTLVDAVHYVINKENATEVVDIATLTGAVLSALGTTRTGVVSNNDKFFGLLSDASDKGDEKLWRLPHDDEYRELLNSDIADIKNLGGKFGGSITAGLFIREFVEDKPWAHMDIAGTAWLDAPKKAYHSKGATGAGVKTLYYLAKGE